MPILNFKDIPAPVCLPSGYTDDNNPSHFDDFEKFAQDFFLTFYEAEICEPVSRGADKGRDLVIEVVIDGIKEKWMVSCKHTAHGTNAVTSYDENNLMNRFDRVKDCTRFIGFYSHIASADLRQTLEDFAKNEPRFKYKIFNNVDIERELLSASDGKGWFFACRHFHTSFSRLFSRFLMPIEHYKMGDIKKSGERGLRLPGPGGGQTQHGGSSEDKMARSIELVRNANETITNAVHEAMFARTLLEISKKWPGCFHWWSLDKPEDIQVGTVIPSFDVSELLAIGKGESHGSMILVSSLWSWWNYRRAADVFEEAWIELGKHADKFTIIRLLNPLHSEAICNIDERDLLTRFVAFAQGGRTGKSEWDRVASIAEHFGLSSSLDNLIKNELKSIGKDDQKKVRNCKTSSEKLNLIAYYADSDKIRLKLKNIDERLVRDYYCSFNTLVETRGDWKIIPGKNFEWFGEKLLPTS